MLEKPQNTDEMVSHFQNKKQSADPPSQCCQNNTHEHYTPPASFRSPHSQVSWDIGWLIKPSATRLDRWRIATRLADCFEQNRARATGRAVKNPSNVAPKRSPCCHVGQNFSTPVRRANKVHKNKIKSRDRPGFDAQNVWNQPKFLAAKSQFTKLFRKVSTNFGRALR